MKLLDALSHCSLPGKSCLHQATRFFKFEGELFDFYRGFCYNCTDWALEFYTANSTEITREELVTVEVVEA